MHRRRFLAMAGLTGAGVAVSSSGLANFAPYYAGNNGSNLFHRDPFSLGVASGSPTSDGFVIWTRLAPDPLAIDAAAPGGIPLRHYSSGIALDYEIALDPEMRRIERRGSTLAEAVHGFSVHHAVEGLEPARPYWYRFRLGKHESPVGRSLTLPRPGRPAAGIRLGFTSCANLERGYFAGYRHLTDEAPDLVFMLGDYIYEQVDRSRPAVRRHSDNAVPTTLDAYRRRYAQYRLDPDLQRLHANVPTLVTWDDHEVENDYAGDWSERFTAPQSFALRRQAAYRAFFEHMPVRQRPSRTGLKVHDCVTIGDIARISLLDGRQYRSRGACYGAPDRGGGHLVDSVTCPELLDPARTMLGIEQEKWLAGNLKASPARWNLVAQNVIMAEMGGNEGGKVTAWTDAWDGYPAARTRLLQSLTRTRNPVVLSGDIHSFWSNTLHGPDEKAVASEFVTSSITSDGPPQDHLDRLRASHDHLHFAESRKRGYTIVEIDAGRLTTHFRQLDDVKDAQTGRSTLRSFVIEDGKAGAVDA